MEKLFVEAGVIPTPELESQVYWASLYLAKLTIVSLGKVFSRAREIMDWLGKCASIVAKQVTKQFN